jgi:hypothetical protein
MAQEFFVKSDTLEDKVRQILPSQGGLGQNFDLSASTQIVPIVDLTESAEGSEVRADLQTAISFKNLTSFNVDNAVETLVNTTGYFRVIGVATLSGTGIGNFVINDGASQKEILAFESVGTGLSSNTFDFVVFLSAGDALKSESTSASVKLRGCTRQIATITGELVDPT